VSTECVAGVESRCFRTYSGVAFGNKVQASIACYVVGGCGMNGSVPCILLRSRCAKKQDQLHESRDGI
jgi:hypothetical protein